jgi:predicted amidohydrolase
VGVVGRRAGAAHRPAGGRLRGARHRAFVVSAPQYIPRSAFGADFPVALPEREVFGRGGAAIVEPTWGEVIAGPLYGAEGMVVADCDLRAGLHAKRWFDAVGHYSRADVLQPPFSVT